jgi:hypothetical protein
MHFISSASLNDLDAHLLQIQIYCQKAKNSTNVTTYFSPISHHTVVENAPSKWCQLQ